MLSLSLSSCIWHCASVATAAFVAVAFYVCYYVISGYFEFFYKLPTISTSFNKKIFFGSIQAFFPCVCVSLIERERLFIYAYLKYEYTQLYISYSQAIEKVVVKYVHSHKIIFITHHTYKKAHMLPMARYPLIRIENEITQKVGHNAQHIYAHTHMQCNMQHYMLFPWKFLIRESRC